MNLKPIPHSSIIINQVNGTAHSIGRVNTYLTIANKRQLVSLHIIQHFRYPLLIGLDIGTHFGLLLDLNKYTVSLSSNNKSGPSPHTAKLQSTLKLEPAKPPEFRASYLESSQSQALNKVLQKYFNIFSQHDSDIGRITVAKHSIVTTPHKPMQMRPYRRPQHEYDEIKRQVEELIAKGLIRESISEYAFPVTLAPKKDNTKRLCIDYRRLNFHTIDDKMPMPRILEVLDRLSGSKYFTTLDVAWGYWHIEMDPNSIDKTAFVTNEGHYEWLVMPFGLKNAPATFQRIIQQILGPLLYKGAINYLDDIIIYSETFEEHMQLLEEVLHRLSQNNIKLKLKKCHFVKPEVTYLGHTISHNTVKPSKEKTEAIRNFPVPTSLRKVRQFMGLTSYYRRFITNFTRIVKPLRFLTHKGVPFQWGNEQQTAFETLLKALTSEPVLTLYDPKKKCTLYTDASKDGIGATLQQTDDDGNEHVIEYFSKALNNHQMNYSASELECLAVVEAIEHFDVYLSQPFTVITDHSALQWLLNIKKPKGRLYHWSVHLSMYTFEVKHKSGASQQHVDALSRNPVPITEATASERTEAEATALHLSPQELIAEQSKEDLSFIRNPHIRQNITTVKHSKRFKAYVPQSLRSKLLHEFHEQYSHPGKSKTIKLINSHYWWPNIIKDIKHHVESCRTCQVVKQPNTPPPGHMVTPNPYLDPLDIVGIDTIVMGEAASKTRHKYIQVFVDHHSRYVWAYPTATNKAQTIETLLSSLVKFGHPIKQILTDNHLNFKNKRLQKFCSDNNIKHVFSTPYHPQTNGIVERVNGTLITKLRAGLEDDKANKRKRKWSTILKEVVNDYNRTPHDVTGFTPAFLLFGTDTSPTFCTPAVSIDDARQIATERTALAQQKRKATYDSKHKDEEYEPGDRVLRVIPPNHPLNNKLTPLRSGPYFVINRINKTTYDLNERFEYSGHFIREHINHLKRFIPRE